MAPLRFAVEPRLKPIIDQIGTEESGIIEIERRGYLTSREKNFVQQFQQQDAGSNNLVALSRKVARHYNVGIEVAYNAIASIVGGTLFEDPELQENVEATFSEDIQQAVADLSSTQARLEIIQASALLTSRVDDSITIEEVVKLHPDILMGLSELYRDEEAKSIEKLRNNKVNEEEEEAPKKRTSKKENG